MLKCRGSAGLTFFSLLSICRVYLRVFYRPDGREPVPGMNALNPWFKLKPTQWYMYTDSVYHLKSFNAASVYSTKHLRVDAYQRNAYYCLVQEQIKAKVYASNWFGAAELVAGLRGVGGTAIPDFGIFAGKATDKFLQGENEFLFSYNMKNVQSLLANGELSGGFIDAKGTKQSFNGFTGIALDNKMVEFEQSKVQDYINGYNGKDLNNIITNINDMINGSLPSSEVKNVIKNQFNNKFDFRKYEDRVKLGQGLIKKEYE